LSEFPIVDVPAGSEENVEQLGTKPKFWFHHPQFGRCLCKIVRPGTGEDWSEKIASELAGMLGLPHATYELGLYRGQPCVVTPSFVQRGCTLTHGNELLGRADPSYERINVKRFRAVAHTINAVWDALHQSACELPLNWAPPNGVESAFDVFVGYILLDAVVGNTDRHDENWGIVQEPEEATARRHLAPTFDHASCLGCHLTDETRAARMATNDTGFTPEAYASKARSAFFADRMSRKPMLLCDAFARVSERALRASAVWLKRLNTIGQRPIEEIFSSIPAQRCSPASSQFAIRILLHNVERLVKIR
jgi:hypothetical protein